MNLTELSLSSQHHIPGALMGENFLTVEVNTNSFTPTPAYIFGERFLKPILKAGFCLMTTLFKTATSSLVFVEKQIFSHMNFIPQVSAAKTNDKSGIKRDFDENTHQNYKFENSISSIISAFSKELGEKNPNLHLKIINDEKIQNNKNKIVKMDIELTNSIYKKLNEFKRTNLSKLCQKAYKLYFAINSVERDLTINNENSMYSPSSNNHRKIILVLPSYLNFDYGSLTYYHQKRGCFGTTALKEEPIPPLFSNEDSITMKQNVLWII